MGLSNYLPSSRLIQPGVCTSSTRPASPFEGQYIYETDTNRTLVYDGGAWVMTVDADSPPGMVLIKTQTVGTAVSSVEVTNAFSADFDNYVIHYNGIDGSTGSALKVTLGSTVTGYYYILSYGIIGGSSAAGLQGANATGWDYAGVVQTDESGGSFELWNPYLTKRTAIRATYLEFSTVGALGQLTGFLNNATSYTSFTITSGTGTLTGGTIRVYGYRNTI
jgi:hypothetical protein